MVEQIVGFWEIGFEEEIYSWHCECTYKLEIIEREIPILPNPKTNPVETSMERDEPITKARGNPATKTVISIQQNVIPKRRDKIIDILIAE